MRNFRKKISTSTQINGTSALALFPLDMDLTDYLSVHHFSRQSYCRFMRRYYSGARASIIWYFYLCLSPGWIFAVQPSLLFARVSNSIAATRGEWTGEGGWWQRKESSDSPLARGGYWGTSTTVYAEEFNISLLSGLAAEKIGNDTKYFSSSHRWYI